MFYVLGIRIGHWKAILILMFAIQALSILVLPAWAEAATSDRNNKEYFLQLNIWLPDIEMTTASGEDIEIGIDEIVENLDFTYMSTFGIRKDKWTFLADVVYLNLEHSDNNTLIDNPLVNLQLTNLEMTSWIITPMVSYNVVQSDRLTLDLLAGARYLYLKNETEVREQTPLETTVA